MSYTNARYWETEGKGKYVKNLYCSENKTNIFF